MARRRKPRTRRSPLGLTGQLAVALVLIAILVGYRLIDRTSIGPTSTTTAGLTVARVIDGDTVELSNGEKVRLLGIDTPERNEPLYAEARGLLTRLALHHPARVDQTGRLRDRYGRLLGYLYVDDTLLTNRVMLDSGLAYLYLFEDTDEGQPQTQLLLAAQREAMAAGVGLWTIERTPEDYYVAARDSYRFHRPGCSSVARMKESRARYFKTRNEALYEGLSPCRRCKP